MAQIDVVAVLQGLQQQQLALLQAQAEGLRLQRLLIEHLLGSATADAPALPGSAPAASTNAATEGSGTGLDSASLMSALLAALPARPSPAEPPPEGAPAAHSAELPLTTPPEAPPRRPEAAPGPTLDGADVAGLDPPEGPPLPTTPAAMTAVGTGPGARGSRYFQPHPARPAKRVTPHELSVLRRLADAGDAARLVLQFGPHRRETLGQVAQADPAYVRELALKAQRPNVRAAALQLVSVLEAIEREQKTTPKRSRGRATDNQLQQGGR